MTAVPEISQEQIEGLGRRLYLTEENPSAEDMAEYEDFVKATSEAVAEHESARILLASYLGIIERGEAEKLAAEVAERQSKIEPEEAAVRNIDEVRRANIEELRGFASEATEFEIDSAVAAKLFEDQRIVLNDADSWGAGDTVVREDAISVISDGLIGREWPKNGDKLTDEEFDSFLAELKIAHDKLLAELRATQID